MKHTFITRYYEDGAGDGGGGGTQNPTGQQDGLETDGITLKEGYKRDAFGVVAKDPNHKPAGSNGLFPPKDTGKPDKSGDGQGAGGDGSGAAAEVKEYVSETDGLNKDGTLKEGMIREDKTDRIYKDPKYTAPVEGLNPDGTVKEGYKKEADGTVVKDTASGTPAGDDEGDDEDGTKFFGAVEAITGRKYDIKYPENVNPVSPEGIAFRESFIEQTSAQSFETYLKTKDPRGYAYLMHRERGGTDDDFFGDNKGFQLPTLEEMKASADIQAAVYKQDLLLKGLDPTSAQVLIDTAIKDNTLAPKSEASHAIIDGAQKQQLDNLQKEKDAEEKDYTDSVTAIANQIAGVIKEDMGFVVPEVELPAFQQFIMSNLRYQDGKFFVVQAIGKDNLKTSLESLFFQYTKGDLTKIVTRRARTEAAQKLRLRLPGHKASPGKTGEGSEDQRKNLPLSQILPMSGTNN